MFAVVSTKLQLGGRKKCEAHESLFHGIQRYSWMNILEIPNTCSQKLRELKFDSFDQTEGKNGPNSNPIVEGRFLPAL